MTLSAVEDLDDDFIADILRCANTPAEDELPDFAEHRVGTLLDALERGRVRAAERDAQGQWSAVTWVKRGILLGFRLGRVVDMSMGGHHGEPTLGFFDKHTYPPQILSLSSGVRVVPGGSAVRRGAYWRPVSSACRRCTSTWARGSARER